MLKCIAIPSVIAGYAIYMIGNPGTDGVLFGSVMLIVGTLAGLKMKEIQDGSSR